MIAALGGLYWRVYSSGYDNGKAEIQQAWDAANAEARAKEAAASAAAAKALAEARAKRKVIVQERTVYVDRNIEKLVDSGRCFQPSGVQCLNAAIDGKSACRPDADGTVPPALPSG